MHCGMQKVRANDGTIEFVSAPSRERYVMEGSACLIWNHLAEEAEQLRAAQAEEDAAAKTAAHGIVVPAKEQPLAVDEVKNAVVYAVEEGVEEAMGGPKA